MASVGSPLSSLDIVGTVGPRLWVEKAFSNDSVTVLKGRVSWKLEYYKAMEYYKVTAHNKPQTGDLLGGKNSEDGCLCSDLQPSVECGASCSAVEPKTFSVASH